MKETPAIIIPTFNGFQTLPPLLERLEQQSIQQFEVFIVNDGSTDQTTEVVESNKWQLTINHIKQSNQGRAAARNRGAAAADSSLFIFLDDDMLPVENWLQTHLNHHKNYKEALLVGGIQLHPSTLTNDFARFRSSLEQQWHHNTFNQVKSATSPENLYLSAANLSINRTDFEALGGFDNRLSDAEDFDLGMRSYEEGYSIHYNSEALAYHNEQITCREFAKRQRQYWQAQRALKRSKPELYTKFTTGERKVTQNVIKRGVFNFFARNCWVNLIDQHNFFPYLLPKYIRFKIYEAIVWGLAQHFPQRKL